MSEACSVNPKGLAGREDQIFQIIKLIRPELSDSDVVDAIVQEMIDRALMPLDDKAAGRLYKRILGYRFVKFPARLTIQEFLSEDFPEDLTHIIVRLGPARRSFTISAATSSSDATRSKSTAAFRDSCLSTKQEDKGGTSVPPS